MTIVLDIETTGLIPRQDEILQLAIIDDQANILFNEYIKPVRRTEWKKAEAINGISPVMVKDKQPFSKFSDQIQMIIDSADTIIGYNLHYDLSFLTFAGIQIPDSITKVDVMEEFAPIYGDWDPYYNTYKWQKLVTAAAYYSYDGGKDAHDALADTRMTLFVYKKMNEISDQIKKML